MISGRARLRAVVAAALLTVPLAAIAAAGFQTARATFREYLRLQTRSPDLARRIDGVMAELEDVLPPHGRVGYLDPQYFAFQPRAVRQYYLTQYALAPRVVIRDATPDYVIYFSHEEVPLTTAAIPGDMRVLHHVRPHLAVLTRVR